MESKELTHILIAFLILSAVMSWANIIEGEYGGIGKTFLFVFIILAVSIGAKKLMAHKLDADVENKIWEMKRYGLKPDNHLNKEIKTGIIVPLVLSLISLGVIRCSALLTYETKPLKRRAARRFGGMSFTEITDWHNALIGAAGTVGVILIAIISYWIPGLEGLPVASVNYAFWNMLPISRLDGNQIYFGSRPLYTGLAIIVGILALIALSTY